MVQIWENRPVFSRESHQEKFLMAADHQNIFDYCPARQSQAWYVEVYRLRRVMRTVQAKRVKINGPAKYAGILVICVMLASCSNSQNAFFTQRNALMSQGYTWQKLDRCRPAKEDALSIPVIGPDGRKLVCYVLVQPQSDVAASAAVTTPAQSSSVPLSAATTTPATTSDTNSGNSGIMWNFSNF